jgi:hypothetical protein
MKLKVSSSIAQFKERAEKTFNLKEWEGVADPDTDLLFFGLYHERDYDVFDNFKGKKSVLWAGGDILRLMEDYERQRVMKNNLDTIHYCENETEAINLRTVGIEPIVIPSFLDDVSKYPVSFPKTEFLEGTEVEDYYKHIWMCAHPEREDEYGVPLAKRMAKMFPDLIFHIYGVERTAYEEKLPNVVYHGHVSEEQLNKEIQNYHCGFRPNMHDGFSEVIIKSVLLGQYPITRIKYENVWNYTNEKELIECFNKLKGQKTANLEARTYWIKQINQYPWCLKDYAKT